MILRMYNGKNGKYLRSGVVILDSNNARGVTVMVLYSCLGLAYMAKHSIGRHCEQAVQPPNVQWG